MNKIDVIEQAKKLFDEEIYAMEVTKASLDDRFVKIVELIVNCQGKVIITGMGKPGHIGTKMAATFASLGTPSFFLHPAEALHGDLGMVGDKDIVLAFSYSGESEEITRILPNIKMIGATLIGISGNKDSTLINLSDYSFVFPKFDEACPLGLAPTSSTTVTLAFGDALAVCASLIYGFNKNNFALFHPAGSLGKKLLLKVDDVMQKEDQDTCAKVDTSMKDAIVLMSGRALGMINICEGSKLLGVFTDGDLRRAFRHGADIYNINIGDVMTQSPITVQSGTLAVEALKIMSDKKISALPVIDSNGDLIGTVRLMDITNAGVII